MSESEWIIAEPIGSYTPNQEYPFQKETYMIIGICMEIHTILGKGFSEIVYKDALELECKTLHIPYSREKVFKVNYKGHILPHFFSADFIIHENIVVEVKAQKGVADENVSQVLNYLKVSKCPVGLLINFGEDELKFKRYVF